MGCGVCDESRDNAGGPVGSIPEREKRDKRNPNQGGTSFDHRARAPENLWQVKRQPNVGKSSAFETF